MRLTYGVDEALERVADFLILDSLPSRLNQFGAVMGLRDSWRKAGIISTHRQELINRHEWYSTSGVPVDGVVGMFNRLGPLDSRSCTLGPSRWRDPLRVTTNY